jgi:hypothetical protein
MAFRFRKSIRLFPGVRVNLSKSTPSISVGERGHTINIGEHGTRATIGAPGTGLSYTTPQDRSRWPAIVVLIVAVIVLALVFVG